MIMNKLKKNYVSILNKYTAQIILAALLIFFGAAVGFGKFFSSANLISDRLPPWASLPLAFRF